MHSASRSVTMTRRPHRRQGRKSRLLAKMASLGGIHAGGARPFRRSMTGSGDIGVCPGDGPRFLPVGVSLRAQGGRAPCRCRKGAGEGGLASPVPTTQRGDHGQDRSKSRRKAHVRRGAGAGRSGAGRLRAAQAPPDSPPPELPQICIPDNTGDPRALPEPAPTAPVARRSACRARKISRRRPTSRGSSSNGSRRCAC